MVQGGQCAHQDGLTGPAQVLRYQHQSQVRLGLVEPFVGGYAD